MKGNEKTAEQKKEIFNKNMERVLQQYKKEMVIRSVERAFKSFEKAGIISNLKIEKIK